MTTAQYKRNYEFTIDFNIAGGSIINLSHIIKTYGIPNNVLEVGVFEGSTTFWLADNVTPHNSSLKITSIDPHNDSADLTVNLHEVGDRFKKNIDLNIYKNVRYINKYSGEGLIDLINEKEKFEIIYIDGDHRAAGVLEDLILSWKLLKVGGIILCDDTTTWKHYDENKFASSQMSPRLAVESFIQCNWHKLNLVQIPDNTQTAFIKIAE